MRFIHAKFTAWREHRVLPHQATAATIRRGVPLAVARSLVQNTFTTRRRLELSTIHQPSHTSAVINGIKYGLHPTGRALEKAFGADKTRVL